MKSKKAKEFIDGCLNHLVIEMSDHAKWQLRAAMSHTAELAEQEAEERMRDKAIKHFARIAQFTQYKQVMGEIAPIAVH